MITSSLVIYLLAGAIGGLAIGITGAGIGPISIAVMLFLLPLEGLSESSVLHTAIGTSLAIIFVTSLASIMLHHQNKSVNWKLFFLLLPGSVVGAILGSQIAIYLPIDLLKDIFSIALMLLGVKMIINMKTVISKVFPNKIITFFSTTVFATISNTLGIGDGVFLVPFLKHHGIQMKESVATATAIILPISLIGVINFTISDLINPETSVSNLGYIYLPAFFIISCSSICFALIGIQLAKKISEKLAKTIFGLGLIYIAFNL